jgi:HlyD family secretion protein
MKIVPYDKLQAKVEIASSDIGFVRTGMPVDLSIDSFPATDFGVLEGTVKQIGSDALPPDPQKQREEYRFPATIQLASQQLQLKSGKRLPLQVGMSLHANIKLRKVSYLQLLMGTFRDKADSLRQI